MYSCVELANGSGVSFAIREAGSIVAAMLAGRARPVAGRSAIPWSTPAHDVLGRRPKDLDRANELAVAGQHGEFSRRMSDGDAGWMTTASVRYR
jgi:hypothetical protein